MSRIEERLSALGLVLPAPIKVPPGVSLRHPDEALGEADDG